MYKNIILKNKLELDYLLSKKYILRKNYLLDSKILNSNLIKVVVGPRRAGKSVFCTQLLTNKSFGYVNFEDEELKIEKDYDKIIEAIYEVYDNPKFLFLDEIQDLNNWELYLNKLQRRGYNLIITGSNSRLLGKELSSYLTGRYIEINLLPFDFKEYLDSNNLDYNKTKLVDPKYTSNILNHLENYLKTGGFPDVVVNKIDYNSYLNTLFDSILFKDIVTRHKVSKSKALYELSIYLLSNVASEYTFTNIKNNLGFNSVNTVQKYIYYLEEAYLFFSLNRFSFKVKEQFKAPRKIYVVDNGLIYTKGFKNSQDFGKLIENAVFLKLFKENKLNLSLFYYKTNTGKEIDFLVKDKNKVDKLIQVTYDISNTRTKEREINSLIEASNELKCNNLIIITYNYENTEKLHNKKITFIPLYKFLLE